VGFYGWCGCSTDGSDSMTEEFVSGYVVGFVLAMIFMMIGLPWMVEEKND